jgi:hypothetical protein
MGAVSGLGTTFNLPNYTGELLHVTPQDTPFLSAISGLSAQNMTGTLAGAEPVAATHFSWQTVDLRDAADDRQALEGADAPTASERSRSVVFNVVEIHHEAMSLSYSQQAAINNRTTTGATHPGAVGLAGSNPVTDEASVQIQAHLAQIARDVEKTFLSGTFNDPATNAAKRETRGLIEAISTNALAAAGANLSDDDGELLERLMHMVWASGGIAESGTAAIILNGFQKRMLTKAFVTNRGYEEGSRNVGGVNVKTIETDFGVLNVILDRHMPTGTVVVASLEQCRPVVLSIPDKGEGFFVEELAKTGATDRFQVYGEIGLKYGNEKCHGKITGLATSVNGAS